MQNPEHEYWTCYESQLIRRTEHFSTLQQKLKNVLIVFLLSKFLQMYEVYSEFAWYGVLHNFVSVLLSSHPSIVFSWYVRTPHDHYGIFNIFYFISKLFKLFSSERKIKCILLLFKRTFHNLWIQNTKKEYQMLSTNIFEDSFATSTWNILMLLHWMSEIHIYNTFHFV